MGGLRCQMCLFDIRQCQEEHPFHLFNALACFFTLASSLANLLLLQPVLKRTYTEEDICIMYTFRICSVCVSCLPFTTGIFIASPSILSFATMWHIAVALPCAN